MSSLLEYCRVTTQNHESNFFTPLDMSYFYAYVLKSEKDGNNYFGFTGDIRKRLNEHEKG